MPRRSYDVLIIEDQAGIRRLLREALSVEGYMVEEASSGFDAIKKINLNRFWLVILDLSLPDMYGFEVLREIYKIDNSISVMVITGYDDFEVIGKVRNMGVKYFFSKPFDLNEVCELVKSIVQSNPEKDKKNYYHVSV